MSTATSDAQPDQPYSDPTSYGSGPDDSIADTTEQAAITHHQIQLGDKTIAYTARAGHLVAYDAVNAQPAAKIFYVAFSADGVAPDTRAVTFFYNGGPGSSSVFLLLGSFAPQRIKTKMPDFTPAPPYGLESNPDSLLDRSDLVFINPVGTGYSAAIAPHKNKDFWGVDEDAASLRQFIERFLTVYDRWNSPKFLFGESYGTARSCVLGYLLHEAGIDLNGITLQSSILDYSQSGNPIGLMPTCAADACYHNKLGIPKPADLSSYMQTAVQFAQGPYKVALEAFPHSDPAKVQQLSDFTGIDEATLKLWKLNVATPNLPDNQSFLWTLMKAEGEEVGAYDGRVLGEGTGIAKQVDPNGGANDPTMDAVGGVYTAMWNTYLNDTLKYTSVTPFIDLNPLISSKWDFSHLSPTGKHSNRKTPLYTAGDLAATMEANVDLKVLCANGYYDSVTPFYQTTMDLQNMPLGDPKLRGNLTVKYYPSGHMIYLDGNSRTALKADLAVLYDNAVADQGALARVRDLEARSRTAHALPKS
jgi:carboxypeptidase C (cathepsin A)